MKNEKLFKALCWYLPYELKLLYGDNSIEKMSASDSLVYIPIQAVDGDSIKPILRPLSDLTNVVEHKGDRFVMARKIIENHHPDGHLFRISWNREYKHILEFHEENAVGKPYLEIDTDSLHWCEWFIIRELIEYHFDIFGLIEEGLAVDINTIQK